MSATKPGFLPTPKARCLVINVDHMDFEKNPEELGEIITKIDAELNGLF